MGLFGRKQFEPDGYYGTIPYRAAGRGTVEALINGKVRRFNSAEDFIEALQQPIPPRSAVTAADSLHPNAAVARSTITTSAPTKSDATKPQHSKKSGCGCLIGIIVLIGIVWLAVTQTNHQPAPSYNSAPSTYSSSSRQRVVDLLNSEFGRVCSARLEGFWSDTLRIDWKASTTKMNAIVVLAAIGKTKPTMYDAGIRYLKFPNDGGGYNILDWKTGEKTSISDRAPYYF